MTYGIIYIEKYFMPTGAYPKGDFMKKRLLLVTLMLALLVCLFAVSASAENALKPQDNNAYGELSFFDESITVGRTNAKYGFTPYIDAEGTTYARVVVGDGTTFYTFPTAYVLSEGTIYGEGQINTYVRDLSSLNSAMQAATGTNPNWNDDNIYRIELPHTVIRLNGGSQQSFQGYDNVIEIRLQPNSHVKDQNKTLIFWKCFNLETIHNLDTFTFRNGCLSGSFQECKKLKNLTLGYSPEVTTTSSNAFVGCTALESVNLFEAFPNLTEIGQSTFSGCSKLVSTSSEKGYIVFPSTLTSIGQTAFAGCTSMEILSFPASLTFVGAQCFKGNTSLKLIDFNGNQNNVTFDNNGVFRDCSALKAVSLPKNTTHLYNGMFANCVELEAVYLPSALVALDGNKYGDGCFDDCNKLYFTSQEFDVEAFITNSKYDSEKFEQNKPVKDEVYFFPSNFSLMGDTQNSPIFLFCTNLNPVIVFPETFTGGLSSDGDLLNIGTKDSPKKIVFLGDMTAFNAQTQNNRQNYISFYFMNEADKSPADIGYKNGYGSADATEGYMFFCHGDNEGYYQILRNSGVSEKKTDKNLHLMNPDLTETTFKATCIKNSIETQYCFCEVKLYEGEVANSATGIHIYADDHNCATSDKCTSDPDCTAATEALVHELIETLLYESYLTNGTYNACCKNAGCDVGKATNQVKSPIFVAGAEKGYSTNSDNGIAFGGYSINIDALKEFNRVNKESGLKFGIMLVNPDYLDEKTTFMQNGLINTKSGALQVDLSNTEYSNVSIMINGFVGNAADLSLVISLYAYTDADDVEFIQSEDTKCASAKVTKSDATLYTVTYKSVFEGISDLSNLGEYVVRSKEQIA